MQVGANDGGLGGWNGTGEAATVAKV